MLTIVPFIYIEENPEREYQVEKKRKAEDEEKKGKI